jgi:uncharacterized protein (TIGR02594 family)
MPIDPQWLAYARRQIGIRETPGPANEPRIMAMAKRAVGWLGAAYSGDSVPWCGLFVADCMDAAWFKPPRSFVGVRAKAWANWGVDVAHTKPLGCIVVFSRDGGGHVGFLTGIYPDGRLRILGGNQADAVNERAFPVARVVAYRWPAGVAVPDRAPLITAWGAIPSTGEA